MSTAATLCLLAAAPATTWAAAGAERPAALVALEESRRELASGRFEWRVLPRGDERRAMRFVSRYATNGDRIVEYRGDDEGWTQYDPETGKGSDRFPRLYMRNTDGLWRTRETTFSASFRPADSPDRDFIENGLKDIRSVGIFANSHALEPDQGFRKVWAPDVHPVTEWQEERVGDKVLVTGRSPSGAVKTWLIDPNKGWNAERMTFEVGSTKLEAKCELARFDEYWFPQRTVFVENGRVTETIIVDRAVVNRPGDRPSFTPADIGLEVGSQISDGVEGGFAKYWTGDKLLASPEWTSLERAGKVEPGPTIKLKHAGRYQSPYQPTSEQVEMTRIVNRQMQLRHQNTYHEGLWERYVRAVIVRYDLSDEQSQQAWRILRGCQNAASEVIDRQRNERSAVIGELLDAKEKNQSPRVESLRARLEKLSEPIVRIFEHQLKPRLEKIPTRAQRAAAEQRAAPQKPGDDKAGEQAAAGRPPADRPR